MMSMVQRAVPDVQPVATTSPRCELCGLKPLVFCPADQAFLCRACDDKVHSANFIVLRHSRSALCQVCFTDTGILLQGARNQTQCVLSAAALAHGPHFRISFTGQFCQLCSMALRCPRSRNCATADDGPAFAPCSMPVPSGAENRRAAAAEAEEKPGLSCTNADCYETAPAAGRCSSQTTKRRRRRSDARGDTKRPTPWGLDLVLNSPASALPSEGELRTRQELHLRSAAFADVQDADPRGQRLPGLSQLKAEGVVVDTRDAWLKLALREEDMKSENCQMLQLEGMRLAHAEDEGSMATACESCLASRESSEAEADADADREQLLAEREDGRAEPSYSGGQAQRKRQRQRQRGAPSALPCTPRGTCTQASCTSSVGSCSHDGSANLFAVGVAATTGAHTRCESTASGEQADVQIVPCAHFSVGGKAAGPALEKPGAVVARPETPATAGVVAGSPAPLGRPASSRLKRVLRSWSESLGGINVATQNLAYELFQRSIMQMKRGEVAANFLRVTLAACLWLATKLVELRAHVPGAKEVASVTAVECSALKNTELTVLKLLDWQPLKHVSDKIKSDAGCP